MGTFAYGRETQRRVISALANLRNFQGNERSALSEGLTGLNGPCRRLTNSRYGALPEQYAETLAGENVAYVVYCYGTPIAWVTWDEDETNRVNWIPDWQYSATTTYYQGLVMQAWGKYSDPNPRKSKQDNRGSARGRSSDARYGRHGQEPTAVAHARRIAEYETQRGAWPPGLLERPPVGRTAPSGPPERELTRAEYLADPRLRDPDWTPWRREGSSLPAGADYRDQARVEAERERGRI